MTTISDESPDMFKIPYVPIRPPIPKERRRFPDTIDLVYDPSIVVDPNFDDSAVSCDSPTYFQTNRFISVRDEKPRWQVRQSQEKLANDSFSGDLNKEQVKTLGEQYGLNFDRAADSVAKETEQTPPVSPGAKLRNRRHTTQRERGVSASKKQQVKTTIERHTNRVKYSQSLMDSFERVLPSHTDPGITQIDTAAVKKPIGAPCSLFL